MEQTGALLDMPPKKSDVPPKKKRKISAGRPKATELKRPIASFKGTERFAGWFNGLMAHVRLPASVLIEHALVDFALKHGYNEPPPER